MNEEERSKYPRYEGYEGYEEDRVKAGLTKFPDEVLHY